ncbi:hypothetical protein [Autumnicola psychrophila]|uniref:Glutamine amidotransferase type-2 domain-containing protein n=1 Tax=Autumnicola psychrophila TaxID=3075592 RepID=A0ABU3DTM8_9FLAO|nr:hypothetical protein [Zunongwangia sp. F225]MDT0687077.1 hypothetical protein [Zunongwangia sp. F225]
MSDFIFSRKVFPKKLLTQEIFKIYSGEEIQVEEFHGKWGSLAVSRNLYNGFQPLETNDHIFVVLGGPVLCFANNSFLTEKNGTEKIYNRWRNGEVQCDKDLSGPFAIFIINKSRSELLCVTDLLSFIPLYVFQDKKDLFIASHVDILACSAGRENNFDAVSQADFILNGVVTFPFSMYTEIWQ